MAFDHSYSITLENNKSEKEAINYLLETDPRFLLPDKVSRQKILEILNIDKKYSRAFDLIILNSKSHRNAETLNITNAEDVILVELKTTKKKLLKLPFGFFFGATQSEFDLASQLGDRYKFCFVSLHNETKGFQLLSLDELNKLIKNKRVQYQINLKNG